MLPLIARLRPNGQVCYLVAQHMAYSGHSEILVKLMQRESYLPVEAPSGPVQLLPDRIYMIPAGRDGVVSSGFLKLVEPSPQHISTPSVNALFASLSEHLGNKAIGVVLSGTGSDGVAGCRKIRACGGLIIAQNPDEAKYPGMPVSVIDAGLADFVLTVKDIGALLSTRFETRFVTGAMPKESILAVKMNTAQVNITEEDPVSDEMHKELALLLHQVLDATGIDFSSYKEETLIRRLEKRKKIVGTESASAYQAFIKRQPKELYILQNLFLVSKSSFFRDRDSFRILEKALSEMILDKRVGDAIKIWVPGCGSGEEAYTLAIILKELLGKNPRHPIVINASDLNSKALELARIGVYRHASFQEMELRLRDRWFIKHGQDIEVSDEIKACVRFEQFNVLNASPYVQLDLVSCRNLLIYLKVHLQDRLITAFHHALKTNGLLFIGQYESPGFVGSSLFSTVDHYHRLFRKRGKA